MSALQCRPMPSQDDTQDSNMLIKKKVDLRQGRGQAEMPSDKILGATIYYDITSGYTLDSQILGNLAVLTLRALKYLLACWECSAG